MTLWFGGTRVKHSPFASALFFALTFVLPAGLVAQDDHHQHFQSDTLVLSRSVYEGKASTVTIGETLPLGCQGAQPA